MKQKIAIAADHGGFALKQEIKAAYPDIEWLDLGTNSEQSTDYPDFAFTLAMAVAGEYAEYGIAICTSGIGMSIAANRHPLIRAALCLTPEMATMARDHNDANVLVLGSRFVNGVEIAKPIIDSFLNTPFSGAERHVRRNRKLALIDDEAQDGCGCGHDHGDHDHDHDHHHHGHDHGDHECCGGHHHDHDHDEDDHTSPKGGCCGGGKCGGHGH